MSWKSMSDDSAVHASLFLHLRRAFVARLGDGDLDIGARDFEGRDGLGVRGLFAGCLRVVCGLFAGCLRVSTLRILRLLMLAMAWKCAAVKSFSPSTFSVMSGSFAARRARRA